jgi:acyl-coenzyme A synthetase/AMP-(fatty) acid ligase
MRNQCIAVLNDRLEPCPSWVVGQIHIAGTGLALGYWADVERTAAAFVQHPGSGQRWYRTGDLGRRLPDGNIEFLGRNDTQVKVQGFRIELGEIESTMARHPDVAAAVAVAVGERQAEKRLGGFYVLRPGAELAPEALRDWLRRQLPEYMVPMLLAPLDALPLSRNGKVDRNALPTAALAGGAAALTGNGEPVPPRDAFEEQVAALWCEVLSLPSVGVTDDFFAMGGDSMLAIRLL